MNRTSATERNRAEPESRLFLQIGKTVYNVRSLTPDDPEERRAFRLFKADGTLYDVSESDEETRCDCPDYLFRRAGLDPAGCKHVKALVAQGLIGPTEARPAPSLELRPR